MRRIGSMFVPTESPCSLDPLSRYSDRLAVPPPHNRDLFLGQSIQFMHQCVNLLISGLGVPIVQLTTQLTASDRCRSSTRGALLESATYLLRNLRI